MKTSQRENGASGSTIDIEAVVLVDAVRQRSSKSLGLSSEVLVIPSERYATSIDETAKAVERTDGLDGMRPVGNSTRMEASTRLAITVARRLPVVAPRYARNSAMPGSPPSRSSPLDSTVHTRP